MPTSGSLTRGQRSLQTKLENHARVCENHDDCVQLDASCILCVLFVLFQWVWELKCEERAAHDSFCQLYNLVLLKCLKFVNAPRAIAFWKESQCCFLSFGTWTNLDVSCCGVPWWSFGNLSLPAVQDYLDSGVSSTNAMLAACEAAC